MMNPEQPNFFKMMLTESSPQEDTLSKLNKEKEAIEKDLEDKKITQDVYDKKIQEVQTRIDAETSKKSTAPAKANVEALKVSTDISEEKNKKEDEKEEKVTEVSAKETEDKTPKPPKVKEAKIPTKEKEMSVQEKKERQAERKIPEQDKIKVESKAEQLPIYEQKEDFEEVIMQKIQELKTIQSGNLIKINEEKFKPEEYIGKGSDSAVAPKIPPILGQRNPVPHKTETTTRSLNSIGDSGLIIQNQKISDVSWRNLSY